ncbi:MAG: glycosyltransferase family 39 protein [Verrucomicrobia bacterium]|nr:glycosyltransferase family 39 protein [Kiritimatiellia bacterium]MCO6399922.1 glycosyltransferase family 39 protein [Verrucomicrobiota bacterium]
MNAKQKTIFWALLVAGLIFRLLDLGRASFQIDEVNVVQFALQEKGLFTAYGTELQRFLFMHRLPLLMIVLKAVLWGHDVATSGFPSEFLARLPFTLIGVASLPLVFALTRRLAGVKAALWAMALTALSPFHVYYSREAYDYSMLICFSTGVLWAGLRIFDAAREGRKPSLRDIAAYGVLSVLLLYAHLSGLVFLASWCAVLGVALLANPQTRTPNRLLSLVAILGAPFLFFLPFLLKLLGKGWVDSDASASVRRISSSILKDLLGRMGWGEAWWALLPFIAVLGWGVYSLLRAQTNTKRTARLLLVHLAISFALQAYLLRVARFEIRYFAASMPILLVVAGVGIASLSEKIVERAPRILASLRYALAAVLLAWLGYNSWLVTQLECRGSNFKELARWVQSHLPENGIYCFWNGYELRGVPSVYPTPGRSATFPVTWSSAEDYRRLQVQERMVSLFQRFPTTAYVEYWPTDLLDPLTPFNKPVPRSDLFVNQVWLTDPAFQKMVKLKTQPTGDTQWQNRYIDHILISYNRPEDMAELARKQGRALYHYFGADWHYVKDRGMNDWLVTRQFATLIIGNASTSNQSGRIAIQAMAPPNGCRLTIYGPDNQRVADRVEIPGDRVGELAINALVAPGEMKLTFEVLPSPKQMDATLYVHGASVSRVAPQN